jgi:hypothetical protein
MDVIYKSNFALWNVWVHFSMLFINSIAFYGLLFRKKWGYYCALTIFILFGVTQVVLGVFHITSKGKIPFEIQNYGAILFCITAVICLFVNYTSFKDNSEKHN